LQRVQQVAGGAVVEAPFALFQEQVEVAFRNAVVTPHVSFGLVPKVLDAIDMIVRIGEELRVIDQVMMELRDIQHNECPEAIGVDDTIRSNILSDYSLKYQ
jgi:hypothetical protein